MIAAFICAILVIAIDARRRRKLVTARMFSLAAFTYAIVQLIEITRAMFQAHATGFVVMHVSFVLIGVLGFGFFTLCYLTLPRLLRRPLSERLGQLHFWIAFAAFNLMFLDRAIPITRASASVVAHVESLSSLLFVASSFC